MNVSNQVKPLQSDQGQSVATERADYRVRGLDCAEEVSLIRGQLGKRNGVRELAFDVLQGRMLVDYDPALLQPAEIENAVSCLGMKCEAWREDAAREGTDPGSFWQRHGLTLVSGVSLLAGMVAQAVSGEGIVENLLAHQHGHHVLAPAAVFFFWIAMAAGAIQALPKAWAAARMLRLDMNALVVLSLVGAAALSEWVEAATLAFLFSVATRMESWSMARARAAIAGILEVTPPTANVVHRGSSHGKDDHGQHEHVVPVNKIEIGTVVRVKPGERIPFDGIVERGGSTVNQALITGESATVDKHEGDTVYAGTMNEDGVLEVRTTRTAADTTLARMIRMVEQSQQRRAPAERFVERFTRYYTPAVFLLALGVAVIPPLLLGGSWAGWFYQSMVILLISCPCALVISTPVSIVAALTAAARNGVLIKGGVYLEEAAKIRAIAFDKTGVLTEGRPAVQRMELLNGKSREQVLQALAEVEQSSEHPIAKAVFRYAVEQGVVAAAAGEFRALPGRGVEAKFAGEDFWVGSARMMQERGLETAGARQVLEQMTDESHSVVACGTASEVWALLSIADPPRTKAPAALTALRHQGMRSIAMLTGDNQATAERVAGAIGVTEVHANLLPEDKATRVQELMQKHQHVAMVGDGVNDAQALASASLGITMGRHGSDIAKETADIILMSNDLTRVPFLLRHAKRTLRVIKENLALALGLKLFFLVAAIAGAATLWMAVLADMGATFLVTFNGLRLLRASAPSDGNGSHGE